MTRPGFTLVELLVVIGIILLLIGIAVVGFNQLDRVVTAKSTKATLQNAQGMVDEFAATNGTGLLEEVMPGAGLPTPVYTDPNATSFATLATPGDVSPGGPGRFATAVTNTGQVMRVLQRIPANKQVMLQMPTKQILAPASGSTPLDPPQLTDGWRDPILFVPAGGLTGVIVNYGTAQQTTKTITSPDNRPFWASAGPDGDFSKGDDNVYSFQN